MIITRFSGSVYPDGSASVGQKPREKKLKADKKYDKAYYDQFDSCTQYERHYTGNKRITTTWLDGRVRDSLKFISSPESSQTKKRYGQNGITGYGKKIVRSGAALLEKTFPKGTVGFVTCSLPNLDARNLKIASENFSEIIRIYFQRFKRCLQRRQAPTEIICSIEIQPDRWYERGEIAPHIHYLYICKQRRYDRAYIISADEMRRFWNDAVRTVLIKKGGNYYQDWEEGACVHSVPVYKSAVGYIGKYMSKGGLVVRQILDAGRGDELPSQWWTATAEMKAWIQSEIIDLPDDVCEFIFDNLDFLIENKLILWGRQVNIQYKEKTITVGCVAKITEKQLNLLLEIAGSNIIV